MSSARKFILRSGAIKARCLEIIQSLPDKPMYEISIKKHVKGGSTESKNFYRLCVRIIANELGYDPEEMHQALKKMYLSPKIVNINGRDVEITPSTTEMNQEEVSAYTERVLQFAAEQGIEIGRI